MAAMVSARGKRSLVGERSWAKVERSIPTRRAKAARRSPEGDHFAQALAKDFYRLIPPHAPLWQTVAENQQLWIKDALCNENGTLSPCLYLAGKATRVSGGWP
jgi:hypothetical protein